MHGTHFRETGNVAMETIRDWTYAGAEERWRATASVVLTQHSAIPTLEGEIGCVIKCACEYRGRGLDWLNHLNDSIREALRD